MDHQSKHKFLFVLFLLTFVIQEMWTLVPYSDVEYDRFIFSDQFIADQPYLHYICIKINIGIYILILSCLFEYVKDILQALLVIQVMDLIEFFLAYNEAWGSFMGINIHITNIRYLIIIISSIYKFVTWKT